MCCGMVAVRGIGSNFLEECAMNLTIIRLLSTLSKENRRLWAENKHLTEKPDFLSQEVRKVDIMGRGRVGRDGGDEFVILLPEQTQAGGEKARERLLDAFKIRN